MDFFYYEFILILLNKSLTASPPDCRNTGLGTKSAVLPGYSMRLPMEQGYHERRRAMLYFVKDNTIHRYPVPKRCSAKRGKEPLRDTIPRNVEECEYCMHWWPGEDD
jgi:hypothetical protein